MMTLEQAKKLQHRESVRVHRKNYSYLAMVVDINEDKVSFVTEKYTWATCKFKNYGDSWTVERLIFEKKSEENKVQYIKFTDEDVDGCGTDISELIEVAGPELTKGVIERTKAAIAKYKEECFDCWDTDGAVDAACDHLKEEGYSCRSMNENVEIRF